MSIINRLTGKRTPSIESQEFAQRILKFMEENPLGEGEVSHIIGGEDGRDTQVILSADDIIVQHHEYELTLSVRDELDGKKVKPYVSAGVMHDNMPGLSLSTPEVPIDAMGNLQERRNERTPITSILYDEMRNYLMKHAVAAMESHSLDQGQVVETNKPKLENVEAGIGLDKTPTAGEHDLSGGSDASDMRL
jgi:hypothetical protein